MHIQRVIIRNFRSFGDEPHGVTLEAGVTALVGENGAGKTAFLQALKKLFSPITVDRRITRDDFHFAPDEKIEDAVGREMTIDVFFSFPELASDRDAPGHLAPLNDFTFVSGPAADVQARLRLEAIWSLESEFRDELDAQMYWVTTEKEVEFGADSIDKRSVTRRAHDLVQMRYIPATRDGGAVTRVALAQLLRRIERSADWDADTRAESEAAAESLQDRLRGTPAFTWMRTALQDYWRQLHNDRYFMAPDISVVAREFEKLIRELELVFEKAPGGGVRRFNELSEGLTSLLYFALSATLYKLERALEADKKEGRPNGFRALEATAPALTIFAVEEHLSPFYLPRLIGLLKDLSKDDQASAIVTSHSAAILRRVQPAQVRHFRLAANGETRIQPIPLPPKNTEAEKYIRQAVHAHPELYFAKLVVLGEGDTEALVIPVVAEARDVPLDPSFVAFVPLSGRHANHMWRLLGNLEIPHLTLLDLDAGRRGGGPDRIKDAMRWLGEAAGAAPEPPEHLAPLKDIDVTEPDAGERLQAWCEWLEVKGIFYSMPLDLDMVMVQAFPNAYGVGDDPDLDADDRADLLKKVYGKCYLSVGQDLRYSDAELSAYHRHFKTRSKPVSHTTALSQLTAKELRAGAPGVLARLIEAARKKLRYQEDAA